MGKIFVVTAHSSRTNARTGIQTLVRGLLYGFSQIGIDFQTVRWSNWRRSIVPIRGVNIDKASSREHRRVGEDLKGSTLLLPEVIYEIDPSRFVRYPRNHQMRLAAIFHDAIPITNPELVRPQAAKCHARYMVALCDVDVLIAVSNAAADQFRRFVESRKLRLPTIIVCHSPGELAGYERPPAKKLGDSSATILCVSTLEPRKNHQTLIEAFETVSSRLRGQFNVQLHLAGDRYRSAGFVTDLVKGAANRNPNIIWHGKVRDDKLADLYREADFTVYPSILEGFGLPIIQSLWNRRPCICANFGAMSETAAGGGCVTVDVRDAAKLSEAILTLVTSPAIREKLVDEIDRRQIKTWTQYAAEIRCAIQPDADLRSTS
jgi:glycosyltransferase involved in cell wall biosynthesis